jgi:hypothetical protein
VLTVAQPNGTLVTMAYDGDLKRRKRVWANSWNSYLWDREQVVLELDKKDNTIARYTLAPFGYGDLVSQRPSEVTSFPRFEALGTVLGYRARALLPLRPSPASARWARDRG